MSKKKPYRVKIIKTRETYIRVESRRGERDKVTIVSHPLANLSLGVTKQPKQFSLPESTKKVMEEGWRQMMDQAQAALEIDKSVSDITERLRRVGILDTGVDTVAGWEIDPANITKENAVGPENEPEGSGGSKLGDQSVRVELPDAQDSSVLSAGPTQQDSQEQQSSGGNDSGGSSES